MMTKSFVLCATLSLVDEYNLQHKLVDAEVADSNVIYTNKFEYIKTYHRLSHEACRHKVVRLSLAF